MASLRLPASAPSPNLDSERLNLALQGRRVDKEVIVWILGHRDAVQRKNITDTYQQLFKESIVNRLQSKLSGALRKAVILWMNEAPERDAMLAHDALKRRKKIKIKQLKVLVEIACASTPQHLIQVRQAYCSLFESSLEEDIISSLPTPLQKLLVGLVSSYRHDKESVDINVAKSEAEKLHEAIERKELDHDDVMLILATRSFFQLRATFNCYNQSYEVTIDKAINSSGNGDLGPILQEVISCIDSPEKYFAQALIPVCTYATYIETTTSALRHAMRCSWRVIRTSTTGWRTTDADSLTRAIVTRAEIDIMKIKEAYYKMNRTHLEDLAIHNPSRAYKHFLMALIGASI